MWRCKHVAEALRDHHYEDLPPLKRVGLRWHVALCFVCGRFHKQVLQMHDGVRKFMDAEENLAPECSLDPDTKTRMKEALQSQQASPADEPSNN